MKLNLLFLLLDENPQKLLFVCPCCQKHNHCPAKRELSELFCNGCGIAIDASQAELEVLTSHEQPATAPQDHALKVF